MYRVIIVEDEPEIARGTKEYVEKNPEFRSKPSSPTARKRSITSGLTLWI